MATSDAAQHDHDAPFPSHRSTPNVTDPELIAIGCARDSSSPSRARSPPTRLAVSGVDVLYCAVDRTSARSTPTSAHSFNTGTMAAVQRKRQLSQARLGICAAQYTAAKQTINLGRRTIVLTCLLNQLVSCNAM